MNFVNQRFVRFIEESRVRVIDLARRLDVTPETLRNDISEMEAQSLLIREHGICPYSKSDAGKHLYYFEIRKMQKQKNESAFVL